MKIDLSDYRVTGEKVRLRKWAAKTKPLYKSSQQYKEQLSADIEQLSELQKRLYASNTHAVLLIFQAMDAAGKDGAISHVLSGINPQGCEVSSFKSPSSEELQHDFLWRTTCRLPARGRIGVFNRSYYEEVLITRVHPEFLAKQHISYEQSRSDQLWQHRYESITDLEKHLHRNGTVVLKFFLHVSKDEQRKRFLERIDRADKNWKFSEADVREREFWDQYQEAYEECITATSTKHSPWHIIPADDKANARLIISRTVIEALKGLDLGFPVVTAERKRELRKIRGELVK